MVRNLNSLADVRAASGEEERYSHSEPQRLRCQPRRHPQSRRPVASVAEQIRGQLAAETSTRPSATFDTELNGLKVGDGYASYDSVDAEQRKQIADKAKALAAALDGIDPALGLSGL